MEIYSAVKKNEILKVAEKELELEMMLSFSEIQILHICSHMWILSFKFVFMYMHIYMKLGR